LLRNAIAILTTPEPLETELEVEEKTLIVWLYTLGVQIYRARFSGHYYPHELRNIVDILKPKKLVPIHTKHPRLVYTIAQQMLEQSR